MAKVTRIKAQDDGKKKTPKAKSTPEPVRKVSVSAKNSTNKRVAKSRLEREAERDLAMREKDRAEKRAIKDAYLAKRDAAKAELRKAKKIKDKAEKKAETRKAKQALKELKKEYRDEHPGYFRGAFREIRQVRWPNRKQTWKLTFAVIVYILLVALLLTVLDAVLKLIFNKLIGGNM